MDKLKQKAGSLEKFKYPALILIIGALLMLLPTGGGSTGSATSDRNTEAADMLSSTEGVGEAKVLISDSGVVVVCKGADDASVRLNIIRAIVSYTGFGSDKITILKMTEYAK